ncbi:MAG: hypothetical protein Q8N60_03850 [Candidatus Diapherotrites archaeon]|nr:hypothetical protein [Candidatus Diapherotrites archaeon]
MRKLLFAPILHSAGDLGSIAGDVAKKGIKLIGPERWEKHLRTIDLFWDSIENYFHSLENVDKFKIFQDGFVASGEIGEKIVNEAASRGSRNYALIKDLASQGAKIMKTEDLSMVRREVIYISELAKSKNLIKKIIAYLRYKSNKGSLLKERDEFIAKTINDSLGEGETGVLFLGAFHDVAPKLAKDIKVTELKEKEKVAQYQKIYYLKTKEKEISELSEYLAAQIKESGLK